MNTRKSENLERRFSVDLLSNYVALSILGVSGLAINIIIAGQYGATALGVFNQAYAVYVLASQFAVVGVHHSTLKHVAEYVGSDVKLAPIIRSALLLSLFTGILTAAAVFTGAQIFGIAFNSEQVAQAIMYAAPGLLCFALNKVNFSVINGLRHMKLFAAAQAARFVLVVGFVIAASAYGLPAEMLTISFSLTEIILVMFLTPYSLICGGPGGGGFRKWFHRHAVFGARSFLGGFLLEANLRIDVLMIGILSSDIMVGVYSLAATFIEGFYNLLNVVRNNVNPLLVQWMRDKRLDLLYAFRRKTCFYIFPLTALAGIALISVYPTIISFISDNQIFDEGWVPLIFLVSGIVFYSGTLPFDTILLQAGHPGSHTLFVGAVTATNITFNLIAIPYLGLTGAALATASSMLFGVLYLNIFLKHRVGFTLFQLRHQ
ncbi:MAG: hypothetical protein CBC23_004110 [Rhodospirillaceae bacterium TMED63]|nr:MAG: hypothetical protein CBC23_004110 [Rhodospirillaceae bacterium TMED63]